MKRTKENTKDLLTELVKTSFKMKYNGSLLGFIWVLLKPFLQFLILYIVFSNAGGNQDVENFTIYLLLGLIFYSFFNETVVTGVNSLLEKAHIILKVNFNRSLVIYSNVLIGLINFIINLFIILFFAIMFPIHPTIFSLIYFAFLSLILTGLVLAVNFFTSIITVKFRDLQHISQIAMQILFYATPIFYQISIVPENLRTVFELNPLYQLIDAGRHSLISGEIIRVQEVMMVFIFTIILLGLGYVFFQKNVKKVAEFF